MNMEKEVDILSGICKVVIGAIIDAHNKEIDNIGAHIAYRLYQEGYRKRNEMTEEVLQYIFDPDDYHHLADLQEEQGWGFTESQRNSIFEHFGIVSK